jgi:hypothetical protein
MQALSTAKYVLCALSMIIISAMLMSQQVVYSEVSTQSPSFSFQEIIDKHSDWVNMRTQQYTNNSEPSIDILAVNYLSDGKTLNATVWLFFPFKDKPTQYDTVKYGMLIDADFSKESGYDGIDNQFEISWNNQTKTWSKILEEWSPNGSQRTLNVQPNYTGFFEKQKDYVVLPVDLASLNYPVKYKVIFYAEIEDKNKNITITDFTRWVPIPPLELVMSTSPNSLLLRPGEEKTIELKVNSTKGFEPTVVLSTANQSGNVKANITFDKLRIPTYGVATTPMTISVANNALIRPYTLFIFANSTFPPEELIKVKSSKTSASILPSSEEISDNIVTQSSMVITVQEPLTEIDKISEFWNKLGSPITFIYGILAGISPWVFIKVKERLKKDK